MWRPCSKCQEPAVRECNGVVYCFEHFIAANLMAAPDEKLKTAAITSGRNLNSLVFIAEALARWELLEDSGTGPEDCWGVFRSPVVVDQIADAIRSSGQYRFGRNTAAVLTHWNLTQGADLADALQRLVDEDVIRIAEGDPRDLFGDLRLRKILMDTT